MSKKLAIFVEGQTELVFTKKLVEELAGNKDIEIQESKYHSKQLINYKLTSENCSEDSYYIIIIDCGKDEHVKSVIMERRTGLISAGYELIIGLRDLHPFDISQHTDLERGLKTRVPTKDIRIEFVIAIMEVEAWFIKEWNHYQEIDNEITVDRVIQKLNFDPVNDDVQSINKPADFLHKIYQLGGKSYTKKKGNIQRTVNVIDYDYMYESVKSSVPKFGEYVDLIDGFLYKDCTE